MTFSIDFILSMLNSGGGTGELQYYGLKFINTFLESADSIQTRLYLQAELQQAGFDPMNMVKVRLALFTIELKKRRFSDVFPSLLFCYCLFLSIVVSDFFSNDLKFALNAIERSNIFIIVSSSSLLRTNS